MKTYGTTNYYIRKTVNGYRVTFPDAPFYNSTCESRFEADQYVSRVNAKLNSKEIQSWPS